MLKCPDFLSTRTSEAHDTRTRRKARRDAVRARSASVVDGTVIAAFLITSSSMARLKPQTMQTARLCRFPAWTLAQGDNTCSPHEVSNPSAIFRSCFAHWSDNKAHFLRDAADARGVKKPPVECAREVEVVSKYDSGGRVLTSGNLLEGLFVAEESLVDDRSEVGACGLVTVLLHGDSDIGY